jgi:hypothetical protein
MSPTGQQETQTCQDACSANVHTHFPVKKPLKGRPLSGKKSHEYQSSFLNHAMAIKPDKA